MEDSKRSYVVSDDPLLYYAECEKPIALWSNIRKWPGEFHKKPKEIFSWIFRDGAKVATMQMSFQVTPRGIQVFIDTEKSHGRKITQTLTIEPWKDPKFSLRGEVHDSEEGTRGPT